MGPTLLLHCLLLSLPLAPSKGLRACESVELVHHTQVENFDPNYVMQIYLSVVKEHTEDLPYATPIAGKLAKKIGGFWDVIFFDERLFAYHMLCEKQVTLAGAHWHVVLCQESIDEQARKCDKMLSPTNNGTLVLPNSFNPETAKFSQIEHDHYMDHYFGDRQGHLSAEREEWKRKRFDTIVDQLRRVLSMGVSNRSTASEIVQAAQVAIEKACPWDRWNVIMTIHGADEHSTHAYYFSEESFSVYFDLGGDQILDVSVYDRRCKHDFHADGMEEEEDNNQWQGFQESGTDKDGDTVYDNKFS